MEMTAIPNTVYASEIADEDEKNLLCVANDNKSVHLPNYFVRNFSIASPDWGRRNVVIQEDSFLMTMNEFILLTFAFANIQQQDNQFEVVRIPLIELCRLVGGNLAGSSDYNYWAKTIRMLSTRTLNYVEDGRCVVFSPYFSTCRLDVVSKVVTLKLNSDLAPYFLGLDRNKTIFLYGFLRQLNTINAGLLYLLCSSARTGKYSLLVNLEHLKKSHGYKSDTKHYISDVILPCLHEINNRTDLNVSIEYSKQGRMIEGIRFVTKTKSPEEMAKMNISPDNKRIRGRKRLTSEDRRALFITSPKTKRRDILIGYPAS